MTLIELLRIGIAPILFIATFFLFTKRGQMAAVILGMLVIALGLATLYRYDLTLDEYIAGKARFCGSEPAFFGCIISSKFESNKVQEVADASGKLCDACKLPPRLIYRDRVIDRPVLEKSMGEDDVLEILPLLHTELQFSKFNIAELAGVSQISAFQTNDIVLSNGTAIKNWNLPYGSGRFLSRLVSFRPSCVREAKMVVNALAGEVIALEWIGDISKKCYDEIWFPALAKIADFNLDVQFRSRRIIETSVRISDSGQNRIMLVASRSPQAGQNHVGLRVAFYCRKMLSMPARYEELTSKAFFLETENIAQR